MMGIEKGTIFVIERQRTFVIVKYCQKEKKGIEFSNDLTKVHLKTTLSYIFILHSIIPDRKIDCSLSRLSALPFCQNWPARLSRSVNEVY